jgi:protocatechuate 3,4-dioxygenase beta subunit
VPGNDFARIRGYGLGAGSGIGSVELDRLLQPMLVSTVLDFGFPMISALSGEPLSGFTVSGSIESHPAFPLVNLMLQGSPGLEGDLLAAIQAQDTPRVFDVLSGAFLRTLSDNPEPWATSVRGILERVPNAKPVAPRALKGFVGPAKLIREGLQGTELTWGFLGGMTADAVTTFRYDFQAAPDFPVRLHGRVLNAATGAPLAGASVSVADDHEVPVATAASDAEGRFEAKTPRDTLEVTISKPGFFSAAQRIVIPPEVTSYQMTNTLLAAVSDTTGTVGGKVIDAANGQGLPGATVTLVRGLDPAGTDVAGTMVTGEQGTYRFESLVPGSYTAAASKPGFLDGWIHLAAVGGVTRTDFDVTLTTPLGEGYRFILSWGQTPSDLDSHLATPTIEGTAYEIRWNLKGSLVQAPYAQLDVDDTSSYGPETITIGRSFDGAYRYAIYQYSSGGSFAESGARVVLYNGNAVVRQWVAPAEGTGRWWYVCDLDAVGGRVTEVDSLQVEPPPGMQASKARTKER